MNLKKKSPRERRRLHSSASGTRAALLERVKELTCLHEIAKIGEQPGLTPEEIFHRVAAVLPPAWQYPLDAASRIVVNGQIFATPEFREGGPTQSAAIFVRGVRRGKVELTYREPKPPRDEGPFLREERNLIESVARQLALIIEQKEAESDKAKLQDQLRHADRLATLGQLAAGMAHELNEPLSNILGFAQLAQKCPWACRSSSCGSCKDKEVYMVGSSRPRRIDVRIVASTNKNLSAMVGRGVFREDLFYRLNVLSIEIPPLRERGDDILLLARHFLRKVAKEAGREGPDFSEGWRPGPIFP